MPAGHLRFKLLAVDVPCAAGGEQRIYLEGGPALYERGGVLGELREPFIRVRRQWGGVAGDRWGGVVGPAAAGCLAAVCPT